MKKTLLALILAVSLCTGLCACQQEGPPDTRLRIVTTIFPVYDWVREITAGSKNVSISFLQDNGADLHNYQPSVSDIVSITSADVFIHVGGQSDSWVADALKQADDRLLVLNLMESLGDARREEEQKEGMETEAEEEGEAEAYDEHIWLSLRNAETLCRAICETLCRADASQTKLFRENTDAYLQKLDELDRKYSDAAEHASVKTLLFGARFPFRYLTADYGLDYYAAFMGCSAESEASFGTVVFLASKCDELGLSVILQIDGSDGKLAETIRRNTASGDQRILTMNSMQSCGAEAVDAGTTYLSIMEENLTVLIQAMK